MDKAKFPRIYQSATWTWTEALTRKVKKPDFVVDGLIPQRGVTLITGEGGIGKSFILLELAWAVSTGAPFLGHFPCRKGPVVFIDLENDEATITRRIQKITTAHSMDNIQTPPPPRVGEGVQGERSSGSKVSNEQNPQTRTAPPLPFRGGAGGEVNSAFRTPHSALDGGPGEASNDGMEDKQNGGHTTDTSPNTSVSSVVQNPESAVQDPNSEMEAARAAALYEMKHPKTEPSDVHFVKKSELAVASMYLNDSNGRYIFQKLMNKHLPYLVLIDPLTCLHSSDENDNVAMRHVIMLLQNVARQLDGAVVMVHHPRKRGMINDPGQMIRGASDLRNAVDSHIFLRRIKKNQIAVEHDKSRHASEVDRFRMEITDDSTGTATHIRYIGSPKEGSSKLERAKESILAILQEQQTTGIDVILNELQLASIPESTGRRALRQLLGSGQVINSSRGLYSLAGEITGEAVSM